MKKGLPQSMRNCLVYITHKMDDAIYRYLSYLMKETEGVMDMLVCMIRLFSPSAYLLLYCLLLHVLNPCFSLSPLELTRQKQ